MCIHQERLCKHQQHAQQCILDTPQQVPVNGLNVHDRQYPYISDVSIFHYIMSYALIDV
jgi:hypothetical protein